MFFGRVPVREAEGAMLAHQVRAGETAFRKGHRLEGADCLVLAAAGVTEVTIARLDPGDLSEDEAAAKLAEAALGPGLRADPAFTGRANLFATEAGLFLPDPAAIDAFNLIDPDLTLATLPAFRRVVPGEMVATVKIIPFAVPGALVEAGCRQLAGGAMRVSPFRPKRVALISLRLPGLKDSVIEKTRRVMEERLAALGSRLVSEARIEHRQDTLESCLAGLDPADFDILIVFGAAAIADRRDVIPAALVAQGGRLVHLGMPVDPGNLLMLAEWQGRPVIGAPGCARSPRENGFDWVLARLCADLPVSGQDIQRMGTGGLLMEIVSRPQPRAGEARAGASGAPGIVILAAGRSTRFGAENKLLAPFEGQPMLARVLEIARTAGQGPLVVVTGHEAEKVEALAAGTGIRLVTNPEYRDGLATSLRAGLAALPDGSEAAFVMLGDMPRLHPETLQRLAQQAVEQPGMEAFVPLFRGQWGNPVLVRRSLFPDLMALTGDQGARRLLEARRDRVAEVPVEDPGILADFDTPAALEAAAGGPAGALPA
ncbi:MAG: molybdopterin-binding/glycosyltransferase family 2 protein [Beijerinckiaceae bacterium]|nr:molybdopterin-binding/glycosyltransferase family 2 protein [Beijerinckiaceae bacterium]